jgi:hypothetical protein
MPATPPRPLNRPARVLDPAPSACEPALTVADQLALQQLANRYWALADGAVDIAIAELFAHDGLLELGSLRLEGVEAIGRFFADRAAGNQASGRVTRHFASSSLATPLSADTVRVRSTVIVYAGAGVLPVEASAPSGIADFEDVCIRSGSSAWVYRSRVGKTVFIGPNAAAFAS